MAMRKRTLRRLPATTRKLARLIGQMESATLKLKHLLQDIQELETANRLLHRQVEHWRSLASRAKIEPLFTEENNDQETTDEE